jgi:hypothetical protein
LDFNVKVALNGNGFGDGDLVDSDSCFVHRENKIQGDLLAVKLFLKLLFTVVDLFWVNFASSRIGQTPWTTDFYGSFHTSTNNLLSF